MEQGWQESEKGEGRTEQYLFRVGLIVPGKDGVTHTCDNGWWGKGIYISPYHSYSMGYMYGGKKGLFLCTSLSSPFAKWLVFFHNVIIYWRRLDLAWEGQRYYTAY
jgi:hypothetical protein